jgi:hypothetical protein
MQNILTLTPKSLQGLTHVLETTTLKEFNGKNVTQYVSFLARSAIEQLRNNEALPFNIMSIVANALKQCETKDFIGYILTMYNNNVQHVRRTTVDEMMMNAKSIPSFDALHQEMEGKVDQRRPKCILYQRLQRL